MRSLGKQPLLDANGQPLSARVQEALRGVFPKFCSRFPALDDDAVVTGVLEEAGQRIEDQERRCGEVNNLRAYAWRTVLNVARSRLRNSAMRLERSTLGSEASAIVLSTLAAERGSPEQIETDILLDEILAQLSDEERELCALKKLGFSSRQIASSQGTSVDSVNTLFYRMKRKVRATLDRSPAAELPKTMRQRTRTRPA